ncbi:hypothetical protein [Hyphomicrobium sp. CS1GBMeth3]|uniref:AMP-binding enzyme n=1 Tax=Hyphomicrobium sp. CS1GBMeth3 TaxID=1892845 RepID=UPI000A7A4203|nr:hypothetical protein [Hyphomicrobium sp. CS1GBMeth3]
MRTDVHVVGAFIVLQPNTQLDAAAVGAFARERLAAYKCPREIRFVDALPRTVNGKIKRAALVRS